MRGDLLSAAAALPTNRLAGSLRRWYPGDAAHLNIDPENSRASPSAPGAERLAMLPGVGCGLRLFFDNVCAFLEPFRQARGTGFAQENGMKFSGDGCGAGQNPRFPLTSWSLALSM